MFGKNKTDVLVVGAGPVGLFTAFHLLDRGIDFQIIDQDWRTAAHSYACALHSSTLELLARAGLLNEIEQCGHRIEKVAFFDGRERKAELDLTRLRARFPYMLVLRQDALEGLFENRLEQRGIKVQWNHRFTDLDQTSDGAVATVEKHGKEPGGYAISKTEWVVEKIKRLAARFVIGADGRGSKVRRALDISYRPIADPLKIAVFEFETDNPGNELQIVLDQNSTNVLWPMPDGHCRWSFQLHDVDVSDETRSKRRLAVHVGGQAFPYVNEDRLRGFIAERAPWFQKRVGRIHWSMAVRFEAHLAASFGRGRCLLAGDAGHMTGPVGMQSMNVGFREGYDLAGMLNDILSEKTPVDLLEDYRRDRLAEWQQLLALEGGLKPSDDTDPWISARIDRLLSCLPGSGAELKTFAQQLKLGFEPTPQVHSTV